MTSSRNSFSEHRDLPVIADQLEKEKRAKKLTEDRNKELVSRIDRLDLALQNIREDLRKEKELRVEAEERCSSLQNMIDKLEEYLRKKTNTNYGNDFKSNEPLAPHFRFQPHKFNQQTIYLLSSHRSIAQTIDLEKELEETNRKLRIAHLRTQAQSNRCEQLECLLQKNGIAVPKLDDKYLNMDKINGSFDEELDF